MRLRAQEWIRRHPEILDERDRRADRRRRDDAQRHHAAAATAGRRPALQLRLRLGGGRGRAPARLPVHRCRSAHRRSAKRAKPKSRELAPELFAIHPMYAREAEEEIVFLADAFLSHVPESGAHLPHYRSWLDEQDFTPAYDYLHRMLQFLQWQKRQRRAAASRALGAQVTGPPRLSGRCCGPSSPTCTSCTCTATRAPRSPRGPASTPPCTRCTPTPSTCTGWARSGCSGWAGPTIARWRCATAGPTKAAPGHRYRLRRCGGRSDRTGGPGVRRHRPAADRRGGRRDAALAGRASPRGGTAGLRPGDLRPAARAGRRAIRVVQQAFSNSMSESEEQLHG